MENEGVIACCGGGTIGSGFAVSFALAGYSVRVLEVNKKAAEDTAQTIEKIFHFFQTKVLTPAAEVDMARARVSVGLDPAEAYQNVVLIQECGPEDYSIKKGIIQIVDEYAPEDAVYASSTSGLLISQLAEFSQHPERMIGAHPYHPSYLIPLIEITKSPQTEQATVDRAMRIYRSAHKEPVLLQKDVAGFIANRISHAVLREVISLVKNGVCTVEDADKAMVYGPGMRWAAIGPIMVGELLSPNGTREGTERLRATNNRIFQSLENIQELPADWGEMAGAGVEKEQKHMDALHGNTREEIAAFRDKVLLELLKLHGKL